MDKSIQDINQAVAAETSKEGKYLTFTLAHEAYGIGIVVDSVSEVLTIKAEDIEDAPHFGTTLAIDYILGMAKSEDSVKILLDIDKILKTADVSQLAQAA